MNQIEEIQPKRSTRHKRLSVIIACSERAGDDFRRHTHFVEDGSASLVTGLTGSEVSLSDYQGQVVYLDFWASWCTPCRKSLPWADALYQELKDQGFTVLAINLDEEQEMATEFLQEVPLSFPVLYDGTGTVPPQYQVVGMPTSYIVDRDGKLRAVHTGFNPASADQVADAIRTLIAGTGR